ncbi:MAG: type VI secretion system baseplate subunit TssK [Thiolinea sp.]
MPDGTPFAVPETVSAPPPYEVPDDMKDCKLFLALPLYQAGAQEVTDQENHEPLARYRIRESDVKDLHTSQLDSRADLQLRIAAADSGGNG